MGSAVMTPDGMVIASDLSGGYDEDALAAIGSSLIGSARKSLKGAADSRLEMMTVDGSLGKIVIVSAMKMLLLVIIDNRLEIDSTMLDIRGAADKLRRMVTLDG